MRVRLLISALFLAACGGEAGPDAASETGSDAVPQVSPEAAAIPSLSTQDMEPLVAEFIDARIAKVRAEPRSGKAWQDLGFALDAHFLLEEAEDCLREAGRLDPASFPAAYDFAFLGTLLPRDADEVSARFARAAALKPSYAPVFARHGDYLREAGDLDGATTAYESALAAFDRYDYARLGLARTLLESDRPADIQRAAKSLEALFQAFPGDAAVTTALGQALSLGGDADRAASVADLHSQAVSAGNQTRVPVLDTLRADILSLSRSTASNFQRGEKKLRKGDLAGATVEFKRVLSVESENRIARVYLAKTYLGLRRLAEARAELELLLAADAVDADAHALLGQLDTEAGAFDAALAHFSKVYARAQLDDLTFRAWVTALGSKGRWEEAIFRLDEWEAQSPTNPEIGYLRAMAALNGGQQEQAKEALKAAIQRAPTHPMRSQLEARILR